MRDKETCCRMTHSSQRSNTDNPAHQKTRWDLTSTTSRTVKPASVLVAAHFIDCYPDRIGVRLSDGRNLAPAAGFIDS